MAEKLSESEKGKVVQEIQNILNDEMVLEAASLESLEKLLATAKRLGRENKSVPKFIRFEKETRELVAGLVPEIFQGIKKAPVFTSEYGRSEGERSEYRLKALKLYTETGGREEKNVSEATRNRLALLDENKKIYPKTSINTLKERGLLSEWLYKRLVKAGIKNVADIKKMALEKKFISLKISGKNSIQECFEIILMSVITPK